MTGIMQEMNRAVDELLKFAARLDGGFDNISNRQNIGREAERIASELSSEVRREFFLHATPDLYGYFDEVVVQYVTENDVPERYDLEVESGLIKLALIALVG